MNFTPNRAANTAVTQYLNTITAAITAHLPETQSILLAGGFGRGEGSVQKSGSRFTPLNDFDIYLVTPQPVAETRLNHVANLASSQLNLPVHTGTDFFRFDRALHGHTFYVDLKAIPRAKLPKLPPMIRYYELKHASTLLWGDDFRPQMPGWEVADLPLVEGFRLLLNRLALLNLYFSLDFLNRPLAPGENHALHYLCSKIILDIPTALLLLNQQFVPSYTKRAQIFARTYSHDFPQLAQALPHLAREISQTTKWRYRPSFASLAHPLEYWLQKRDQGGLAALYFANRLSSKPLATYQDLSDFIRTDLWPQYYPPYFNHFLSSSFHLRTRSALPAIPLILVLNLLFFLRLSTHRKFHPRVLLNPVGPDLIMLSAMILILFALDERAKINSQLLAQARRLLSQTYPLPPKPFRHQETWNQTNDAFARAYVLFFFLKII